MPDVVFLRSLSLELLRLKAVLCVPCSYASGGATLSDECEMNGGKRGDRMGI